jgi:hypothetical protein
MKSAVAVAPGSSRSQVTTASGGDRHPGRDRDKFPGRETPESRTTCDESDLDRVVADPGGPGRLRGVGRSALGARRVADGLGPLRLGQGRVPVLSGTAPGHGRHGSDAGAAGTPFSDPGRVHDRIRQRVRVPGHARPHRYVRSWSVAGVTGDVVQLHALRHRRRVPLRELEPRSWTSSFSTSHPCSSVPPSGCWTMWASTAPASKAASRGRSRCHPLELPRPQIARPWRRGSEGWSGRLQSGCVSSITLSSKSK